MKFKLFLILFFLVIVPPASFAAEDPSCHPPYQPTNILKVLLNYSPTMEYIATAPDQCRTPFAEKITQLVQSTWLLSQGCKDVTLEDIQKAKQSAPSSRSRPEN